jgi:hypothetical protein
VTIELLNWSPFKVCFHVTDQFVGLRAVRVFPNAYTNIFCESMKSGAPATCCFRSEVYTVFPFWFITTTEVPESNAARPVDDATTGNILFVWGVRIVCKGKGATVSPDVPKILICPGVLT